MTGLSTASVSKAHSGFEELWKDEKEGGRPTLREHQLTDGRSGQNKGEGGSLCSGFLFSLPSTTTELLCSMCPRHSEEQRPLPKHEPKIGLPFMILF